MDMITVPSSLLNPSGEKTLTPAMVTALWVIGDELDNRRIPGDVDDAVWLDIPSQRLRGVEGRNDNVWLRECLDRLSGLRITGNYRGDRWGAVLIAEWHIEQGGSVVRILVPPAAIQAVRAPETFAKIEAFAAYKLRGGARLLYADLADKKRMAKPYWIYTVGELRSVLGVADKKSYKRWSNFRQWILDPAIDAINDFGTVTITMTPEKVGRAITAVRFDWAWKSIDEARQTEEENQRLDMARHKPREGGDAPPMFKKDGTAEERAAFANDVMRKAGFRE